MNDSDLILDGHIPSQDPSDPAAPADRLPEVEPDWTVLDDARVDKILAQVSNRVAQTFAGITTADDQHQEASIWVATNSRQVYEYLSDPLFGERNLYRRLHSRLSDGVATDASRAGLTIPINAEGSASGE